jgi:7,8-dihydropterin-6-yl-methyl-4-(beta-D-ribofuranosyl)aminobenzene 5'-phosphate synthase
MNAHRVRITILVDDLAGPGLKAEHGFSLWIETEGRHILFDTGQGGALAFNARALGVNLSETDELILSHGHYDHTGGIAQVAKAAGQVEVYCHPGAVLPRYGIGNGIPKPIQMPRKSMRALDNMPAQRLRWVTQPVLLSERIGITGPIPRETIYEDTGGPFYLDPEGKRPDPIDDDVALWIRTDEGLVICAGCCHAGLVNTLNHVRRLTNGSKLRAIIGGFHLLNASDQRLEQTMRRLQSISPDTVVPCHCTGERAFEALNKVLRSRLFSGNSGMTFQF